MSDLNDWAAVTGVTERRVLLRDYPPGRPIRDVLDWAVAVVDARERRREHIRRALERRP